MPVDTALIEAVLTPIPGEAPAGQDLRYDPRYEQVKEARREDLALPSGGLATERKLADYNVVMKLGRELLEKETKDLQISAWIAEALLKQKGMIGLATGLLILEGVLSKFWEGCFPAWDEEDPEMRAGPLEWVGNKFEVPVRQLFVAPNISLLDYQASRTVPTEAECEYNSDKLEVRKAALSDGKLAPEVVDRAVADANKAYYKTIVQEADTTAASLATLEKTTDEKFGRDAPSMMKLRAAVDDVRRTAGTILAQKLIDDPDPIVEEVFADAGGAAVDESGPLTPEPVSPADAAKRIAVSAAYLRKQDSTSPGPYLTLRGLRWGELRAGMSAGELNPKLLEAPATAVRSRLKALLLDGKWTELLEQCEGVMATPQGRGWLDLQRYALTACSNLGGSHDAVAHALKDELRLLLAAIPQLPEMTLMDDTPTANAETLGWLEAERLTSAEPAAEPPPPSSDEDSAPVDEAVIQRALVQESSTSKHGGLAVPQRRRAWIDLEQSAARRRDVLRGCPPARELLSGVVPPGEHVGRGPHRRAARSGEARGG
jgi:type VI secretion system protein ImpA